MFFDINTFNIQISYQCASYYCSTSQIYYAYIVFQKKVISICVLLIALSFLRIFSKFFYEFWSISFPSEFFSKIFIQYFLYFSKIQLLIFCDFWYFNPWISLNLSFCMLYFGNCSNQFMYLLTTKGLLLLRIPLDVIIFEKGDMLLSVNC